MHIEGLVKEFKAEVVQLREDVGISIQLAEIKVILSDTKAILVDIRESMSGMTPAEVAELENKLKATEAKLRGINQSPPA